MTPMPVQTHWLFALSSAIAVAAALAGCEKTVSSRSLAATEVEKPVGGYTVSRHAFARTAELPATLLAQKQVTLMAKVPAEVSKIYVVEGDRIHKDQPLVQLDQQDFVLALKQAEAQLAAAKAGVEAATVGHESMATKYGRFSALRKQDAVSENDFDQIESGQKAAAAQLRGAQAQVQLAQVGVEAARTNLGYTVIRAPFDGVVGKRLVDEGTRIQVMPPTPLLVVADTRTLKVVGSVTERDLPLVPKGTSVMVHVDAIGGDPIPAVVGRVEPLVDPMTRTASVYVLIPNPDGRLSPGMSAKVIARQVNPEAPAVPDDAVVRSELGGARGVVFLVRNAKAQRVEVTLGLRDGELVEVTSGLAGGEVIVRGGQESLRDGQPVQVKAGQGGMP